MLDISSPLFGIGLLNADPTTKVPPLAVHSTFGDSMFISVIMPAFNESLFIADNLREVVSTFARFGPRFEVILVDDGSPDNTYRAASEVIREHPETVRIVRYDKNKGKGNALTAGCAFARGSHVVFLDADMDLHPSQLPRFFEIMQESNSDAVIGSKRHPDSQVRYPLIRKIYSAVYYTMVRILFGLQLRDTQTGLKLFTRELLSNVLPRVLSKQFAFDIEVLTIAHRLGYKIVDAPVVLDFSRPRGRIGFQHIQRIFTDTLAIYYRLRIRKYYDEIHQSIDEMRHDESTREITTPEDRSQPRFSP